MIDYSSLKTSLLSLQSALSLLREVSAQEEMRTLFSKLFEQPSEENLARFNEALIFFVPGDKTTEQRVMDEASAIVGRPLTLSTGQIAALKEFFCGAYYKPLRPVGSSAAGAFREFYENLFTHDEQQVAIKDLQRMVGEFWSNGTQQREQEILEFLKKLGPHVEWDGRHVFAFISLLTLDIELKQLTTFEASHSVW